MQKMVDIRWLEAAAQTVEINTHVTSHIYFTLHFLERSCRSDRWTGLLACTLAQTTLFGSRKCLLVLALRPSKFRLGSKIQKLFLSPHAHFPDESIASNSFLTVKKKAQISADNLYQIGV